MEKNCKYWDIYNELYILSSILEISYFKRKEGLLKALRFCK